MFYYVGVEGENIVSKMIVNDPLVPIPDGYRLVGVSLYNKVTSMPCGFTEVDGVIMGVEEIEPIAPQIPVPEPTEYELLQEYLVDVDFRLALVELGL